MHGSPFWILVRQRPPLTSRFEYVVESVPDIVQIVRARVCSLTRTFEDWFNVFKLLTSDVTRIFFCCRHSSILQEKKDVEQALRA